MTKGAATSGLQLLSRRSSLWHVGPLRVDMRPMPQRWIGCWIPAMQHALRTLTAEFEYLWILLEYR